MVVWENPSISAVPEILRTLTPLHIQVTYITVLPHSVAQFGPVKISIKQQVNRCTKQSGQCISLCLFNHNILQSPLILLTIV